VRFLCALSPSLSGLLPSNPSRRACEAARRSALGAAPKHVGPNGVRPPGEPRSPLQSCRNLRGAKTSRQLALQRRAVAATKKDSPLRPQSSERKEVAGFSVVSVRSVVDPFFVAHEELADNHVGPNGVRPRGEPRSLLQLLKVCDDKYIEEEAISLDCNSGCLGCLVVRSPGNDASCCTTAAPRRCRTDHRY
jgi:hypothetical protein